MMAPCLPYVDKNEANPLGKIGEGNISFRRVYLRENSGTKLHPPVDEKQTHKNNNPGKEDEQKDKKEGRPVFFREENLSIAFTGTCRKKEKGQKTL
ncbi:hypothetical protein AVEN_260815-1 [Araneus ventricosus]|uniref:Uncharacterized protein n=1 Tax=Araneus ventricosus TaxID=182803 RepID=A0A4Y2FD82_ARAVE|nr:hypothetical protein AVEN_260815-1 [Araneus ventricosus]